LRQGLVVAIGIRLRDVIGVDNMMWGSDYPHSESTFPQSRKILAEILAGVPDDEQAKIAGGNTARVYMPAFQACWRIRQLGAVSGHSRDRDRRTTEFPKRPVSMEIVGLEQAVFSCICSRALRAPR
jgi:hypothetical protein